MSTLNIQEFIDDFDSIEVKQKAPNLRYYEV